MRIWLDVQIEIHPFILRIRTKCRFEGGGLSEVKSHGGTHPRALKPSSTHPSQPSTLHHEPRKHRPRVSTPTRREIPRRPAPTRVASLPDLRKFHRETALTVSPASPHPPRSRELPKTGKAIVHNREGDGMKSMLYGGYDADPSPPTLPSGRKAFHGASPPRAHRCFTHRGHLVCPFAA